MPKLSSEPITEGLDAPATQFREFAAEYMELARTSSSLERRIAYLNMASAWHQTAIRWETDLHKRKFVKDSA
jgi:hypothetical protein